MSVVYMCLSICVQVCMTVHYIDVCMSVHVCLCMCSVCWYDVHAFVCLKQRNGK